MAPASHRRTVLLLALAMAFVYGPLLHYEFAREPFLKGDCWWYQQAIVSLVRDGDLDLANNIGGEDPLAGYLALDVRGRFVPKLNLVLPVLSAPFYVLGGTLGLLLFNVLDGVALVLLIYALCLVFVGRGPAVATAFLYGTATLFLNYAYNYSPDLLATTLFVGGLVLVLRERPGLGTLLLALSAATKVANAPLVAIVLLYAAGRALWGRDAGGARRLARGGAPWRTVARMALVLVAVALPFAWLNYHLFGSPLVTGYHRAVVHAAAGGAMGFDDHTAKFNQPLVAGLYRLLFDWQHGIIITNPVLLTALAALAFWRRLAPRPAAVLLLVLIAAQLVFFATYDAWWMSHFSNRFLMITVALAAVFTAHLLDLFWPRAAASSGPGADAAPAA